MHASHLINKLSSTVIGDKSPLEVWSGKATQDHDLLRVFESSSYFYAKDEKVNPRAKKFVFWASKEI